MGEERKETSKGGERVFVGDRVQAAQSQLGVATVAAGIIGLFVDPAEGLYALLALGPIMFGLVLLYYGTTRPQGTQEGE